MSNEITEHLNKAKALLIEKYSNSIDNEASQEALKNINKDFEFLEIYANESNTEPQEDEPQQTLKSMIKDIQDMTFKAHELSEGDPDVFGALVSGEIDRLAETLGLTELSITAEVEENLPENTLKAQLQDLHALNHSMFKDDINEVPRFTDGTIITAKDLADMNINALDNIAELIGFELEE
jgi:hypothetical protein